jgi:hypothetical protein
MQRAAHLPPHAPPRSLTRILHKLGRSHQANGLLTPEEVAQAAATPLEGLLASTRPEPTSSYRGVSADGQKWRAVVKFLGRTHHLGSFEVEEEAARVVDLAMLIIYDCFVRDPSRWVGRISSEGRR